jgi:branched-subunit amino acid transport protein
MQRIWAISKLTFAEGIRMRIVVVFLVVLVFLMLRMPFVLRGDDTLSGRLQNFLDYALAAVSILLSLSTVMLSASTLATEFRTKSLQMVVTKPVSRFQILVGKWMGVNLLNVLMLLLCGITIYLFALYIKGQPETVEVPDYLRVDQTFWTARTVVQAERPDFMSAAEEIVDEMIQLGELSPDARSEERLRQVKRLYDDWLAIPANTARAFIFDNLKPPTDENAAIQIKFKVRAIPIPGVDELATVGWVFVDPNTVDAGLTGARWLQPTPIFTSERSGNTHQVTVSANAVMNGKAALYVINSYAPEQDITLRMDDEKGLRLLYTVGTFEWNYAKAILLTFLRLSFLSALGVFFGTFVSFPVACFCGLTWYIVAMGQPFWMEGIGADSFGPVPVEIDPYGRLGGPIRSLIVPLLGTIFPNFQLYSGNTPLIDGEDISLPMVGQAAVHLLLMGLVLLFLVGWFVFREREVANIQQT